MAFSVSEVSMCLGMTEEKPLGDQWLTLLPSCLIYSCIYRVLCLVHDVWQESEHRGLAPTFAVRPVSVVNGF